MPKQLSQRRLAAILVADVVGYSRMMEADEAGTLAALKTIRTELIDSQISEHSGRVFKSTGDGFLAEFPSVVNAVSCAVAIQGAMSQRQPEIKLRIGINLGDVIVEDGDVFGDGVNVAARAESIAPAGGIAVTGAVRDQLGNRLNVKFEDLGEQQLKNIDRPVRIFLVRSETLHDVSQPTVVRSNSNRPSIAVLPFTNMSNDPEQEYFVDGLTEDLIMALGKVRHLHVLPRHTTFQFKNRTGGVQQVGRELGVPYLVEGSVRRSGNLVRVTAQLINRDDGTHLWAERYDRELADVFAVQDEIVRSITAQLTYNVIDATDTIRGASPAASLTAYDYFLRARAVWQRGKYIEAREYLLKAVDADPNYAAALANLAYFYAEDIGMQVSGEPVDELRRLASDYTARAVAANDGDAFSCWMIGNAMIDLGRHAEARHQLESALSLNPFDVNFTMDLGMLVGLQGQHEEGLAMVDRVFRREPQLPPGMRAETFWIRCAMGDPEGAKEDLRRTKTIMAYHHLSLAICLAGAGQEAEAKARVKAFETSRSPWFDVSGFIHWFCGLLALPADRKRFLRGARILGFDQSPCRPEWPLQAL